MGIKNNFQLLLVSILLVSLLLFSSCTSDQEPAPVHPEDYCVSDADCVPLPACHPMRCINQDFTKNYEQPEICTMVFVENAAYDARDCLCQANKCVNRNAGDYKPPESVVGNVNIDLVKNGSVNDNSVDDSSVSVSFDSWHYQLQDATYSSLYKQNVDVLVFDPDETNLSSDDISSLHSQGKTLIPYLSIGEAEDYRSYWVDDWNSNPPSFLEKENPDWEGNFKVKYWNEDWQNIILSKSKELALQGYDGLYMDIVDAYYYFEEQGRTTAKQEMISFIEKIANQTRAVNPNFLIVPQNAVELYDDPLFASIIDGFGVEDIWFDGNSRQESKDTTYRLKFLDNAVEDGKFVLSVDYPLSQENICIYYSNCNLHDFTCTVSNRDLNRNLPTLCND